MFQLNKKEFDNLIFQFGTPSWGGTRILPFAFTEQGVAILSGILNSDRAIHIMSCSSIGRLKHRYHLLNRLNKQINFFSRIIKSKR